MMAVAQNTNGCVIKLVPLKAAIPHVRVAYHLFEICTGTANIAILANHTFPSVPVKGHFVAVFDMFITFVDGEKHLHVAIAVDLN